MKTTVQKMKHLAGHLSRAEARTLVDATMLAGHADFMVGDKRRIVLAALARLGLHFLSQEQDQEDAAKFAKTVLDRHTCEDLLEASHRMLEAAEAARKTGRVCLWISADSLSKVSGMCGIALPILLTVERESETDHLEPPVITKTVFCECGNEMQAEPNVVHKRCHECGKLAN